MARLEMRDVVRSESHKTVRPDWIAHSCAPGTYRLTFDAGTYFAANNLQGLYPVIRVVFDVTRDDDHYHLPLQLSPHGYSTYRG